MAMPTGAAPGLEEEMFVATIVLRESKKETAMATGVAPEPEEKTVVFPDWVMLDRSGRTYRHPDLDAAREAANKKKTAVEVVTATGHRCCLSFAFSDRPEGISYLDLDWPMEGSAKPVGPYSPPAFSHVRATDDDLVLFDINIPSQPYGLPSDLFVYTAGPSPSVQRLPLYTGPRERPSTMSNSRTGILRLADDRYIVSNLYVHPQKRDGSDNYSMLAELCVFDSKIEKWSRFLQPQEEILWSTDHVLSFNRQFLCWADYLSGVLLCDFSNVGSPVLQFVHFPGRAEYSELVHVSRCLASRYRSVSVHQGMMCFVHIDNDYDGSCQRSQGPQQPPQKISIWTLNMRYGGSKFEWKIHREINLHSLWAQLSYQDLGIGECLPEFPVICANDPDALCCLLRDERKLSGQPWMIMVDMHHSYLRSCSRYTNQQPPGPECVNPEAVKAHENFFSNIPLLPTVFSKYLVRPTGIPRDNNKLATNPPEMASLQCEDDDLESGDWSSDILDAEIKDAVERCRQDHILDAEIKDAVARCGQD
ncbi:hypothetical protein ACQJBY_052098 [Aegilops geniculata]